MTVTLRCKLDKCKATTSCDEWFDGANVERGWTHWRHANLITCPAHYMAGEAREREARRAEDE